MSKFQGLRRLQFFMQYVRDNKYPSKDRIIDYLKERDFKTSSRTFERDLETIRTDFGLELTYSKQENGYYIDEDRSVKVESLFKFLELVTVADVLSDGLKDSNKLLDYIVFDDSSQLKGIENLEPILLAIKQEQELMFNHYNYYNETLKPYTITPLILKQYLNRWYVVGVPKGINEIRTFGIDRIQDLKLGKTISIKKEKYQEQLKQFNKIIGLRYSQEEVMHIVLKVNKFHVKYLESLPLHSSQKISPCEDEDFALVSYDLIPNYEFDIQILKMSMEVEVVEPKAYRDKIKNIIENIHNKYTN